MDHEFAAGLDSSELLEISTIPAGWKPGMWELAPGVHGFKKGTLGCQTGRCLTCYNGNPSFQWNDPDLWYELTEHYVSVACPPWIKKSKRAQEKWANIQWADLKNEWVAGTLLGDICDHNEIRGGDYLHEFIRLALAAGARLVILSTRALTDRRDRRELIQEFARNKKIRVLLGLSGSRKPFERIQPEEHFETLRDFADAGAIDQVLALRHPHIHGVSDDSILPRIAEFTPYYSIRGLFVDDSLKEQVGDRMDYTPYNGHENSFYIPFEAELMERLDRAGLTQITVKDWLCMAADEQPGYDYTETEAAAQHERVAVHSRIIGIEEEVARREAIYRLTYPVKLRKTG